MRALWTAATAMESQQLRIDVIANNLANVSTPGYKRSRADFQDLLYQVLKLPGGGSAAGNQVPTGLQLGLGVKPAAISKMFTQGDYLKTGNPLDIAIEGSGFFQILQPTGEASYTRAGAFKIDSNGRVVTSDGIPLEPEILIPADAVDIYVGADGTVSVSIPGQLEAQEVGRIELATFVNQAGLRNIGKNL
ncbi:MAG: flagellar basal-body rod protein FlgG, partial [Thermodesulfobacteriota bacterium]|nr:flagellar basal-body rod protein FlgG [Thermodesulfobacteriota bacterium]